MIHRPSRSTTSMRSARAPRRWSTRSARSRPSRTAWCGCSCRRSTAARPIWWRAGCARPASRCRRTRSARCAGASARAKRLLIGSHIDTVIDAGKYDGPFGVIAGILAAEHFARAGRPAVRDRRARLRRRGRLALSRNAVLIVGLRGRVPYRQSGARRSQRRDARRRDRRPMANPRPIFRRPHTGARTSPPMSRCTSSRARCWRRAISRSAS